MVVQHNLTAMNSNRMLGLTAASQAKSTEKLSSGYKINRAADDAAGLSISEKMRRQIRGLTQASLNAQDGISAVQTAEGALTEVHDMLQRMDELATKAANGTMSADDRQAVQDEIDQLVTEIDRVSQTTKFNEMELLKGKGTTETTEKVVATPLEVEYANEVKKTISANPDNSVTLPANSVYEAGKTTAVANKEDLAKFFEINSDGEIVLQEGKALYTTAANATDQYGAQIQASKADVAELAKKYLSISSNALYDTTSGKEVAEDDLTKYFNSDGTYKGGLSAYDNKGALTEVGAEQISTFANVTAATYEDKEVSTPNALEFSLHVGSESDQSNKIDVKIDSMSAKGIGVDVLKKSGVMSEDAATVAIDTIKDAISKVSKQRSALGAVQNRLEHTINNLDNVVENTTAAESQIRDTDMATEMVKYSNNNILAQAGQAMLAQSNQANQGVLSLLG